MHREVHRPIEDAVHSVGLINDHSLNIFLTGDLFCMYMFRCTFGLYIGMFCVDSARLSMRYIDGGCVSLFSVGRLFSISIYEMVGVSLKTPCPRWWVAYNLDQK